MFLYRTTIFKTSNHTSVNLKHLILIVKLYLWSQKNKEKYYQIFQQNFQKNILKFYFKNINLFLINNKNINFYYLKIFLIWKIFNYHLLFLMNLFLCHLDFFIPNNINKKYKYHLLNI